MKISADTDARPSTHVVVTLKKGVEGLGQVLKLVEVKKIGNMLWTAMR